MALNNVHRTVKAQFVGTEELMERARHGAAYLRARDILQRNAAAVAEARHIIEKQVHYPKLAQAIMMGIYA